MSNLFHADGCVRANIPTREYTLVFKPKCEHTKIKNVVMIIDAADALSARQFGGMLNIPRMVLDTVTATTDMDRKLYV